VSQQANDKQQLEPMLNELGKLPKSLGKVETVLADTGYFSQANVNACVDKGIEPVIAMGRDSHHLPLAERLAPDAPKPETGDPVRQMAWYIKTKEGKAKYAKRKSTVETVFGIVKQVMGFRQMGFRQMKLKVRQAPNLYHDRG
jgi:hypothetical protein